MLNATLNKCNKRVAIKQFSSKFYKIPISNSIFNQFLTSCAKDGRYFTKHWKISHFLNHIYKKLIDPLPWFLNETSFQCLSNRIYYFFSFSALTLFCHHWPPSLFGCSWFQSYCALLAILRPLISPFIYILLDASTSLSCSLSTCLYFSFFFYY